MKEINAVNVVCAEMLLSKFFADRRAWEAHEIIARIKEKMKGSGICKAEIREARKNLQIASKKSDGGYVWTWESTLSPEEMWKRKSEEFMKC